MTLLAIWKGSNMTYQSLYASCHTSEGQTLANELRYLHGFETEAEESDVDLVHDTDLKAMGSIQ